MSTKETKNLRMKFVSDEGRKFSLSVASVKTANFRLLARSCGFSKVLVYGDRNFVHVEV